MFEGIVAVIIIVCIIYFFKDEIFGRNVVVTIVESLPLSIFKKSNDSKKEVLDKKETLVDEINKKDKLKEDENITTVDNEVVKDIENRSVQQDDEIKENYEIEKHDNTLEVVVENRQKNDVLEEIVEEIVEEVVEEIVEEVVEEIIEDNDERLVYWTPKGKSYHNSNTCRTLSRSKVVNSGTVSDSCKNFECEHCK